MSPSKNVEEEERPLSDRSAHHLYPYDMDQAIVVLSENLEHDMDRRYALTDSVRNQRKDREAIWEKDRADYALAQLQVERDVHSLVDELGTARRKISHMNG